MTAALRTPSRSRKTARPATSDLAGPGFLEEGEHRVVKRLARRALVLPAKRTDAVGVQPDNRHVAAPASRAACVFVPDVSWVDTDDLGGQISDFRDSDVVACGDVVGLVGARGFAMGGQNRVDDVLDVDVRLALLPVAKDSEPGRIFEEPTDEVEADTMSLPRADDVAEAEDPTCEAEHEAVRRDQGLGGQLARAVGGDGDHGPPVLVDLALAQIAVDPASCR